MNEKRKPAVHEPAPVKCVNCFMTLDQHTKDKKCLFAPTNWKPDKR